MESFCTTVTGMVTQVSSIRKVGCVRLKELGRQTGRWSPPMEQTPGPSWYQGRDGEQ